MKLWTLRDILRKKGGGQTRVWFWSMLISVDQHFSWKSNLDFIISIVVLSFWGVSQMIIWRIWFQIKTENLTFDYSLIPGHRISDQITIFVASASTLSLHLKRMYVKCFLSFRPALGHTLYQLFPFLGFNCLTWCVPSCFLTSFWSSRVIPTFWRCHSSPWNRLPWVSYSESRKNQFGQSLCAYTCGIRHSKQQCFLICVRNFYIRLI